MAWRRKQKAASSGAVYSRQREQQSLRAAARQERGELCAAAPAVVPRARGVRVSEPRLGDPWRTAQHLEADVRALAPFGGRSGEARPGRRGYRRGAAAQYSRDVRGALRRADERRRAQYAEHPARCRRDRLHAEPWRSQGAVGRQGILRGGGEGPGEG